MEVMDENGNLVVTQIFPNTDFANTWTLVFEVTIPPAGFSTYIIQPSQSTPKLTKFKIPPAGIRFLWIFHEISGADVVIQNENLVVTFSGQTNKLASITNKITGTS